MAYTPTNWVDSPSTSTPISAANLNHMEAGIAAAYIAGTGGLVNADIANAAAIAYSKLALTGAILNADLAGSIAYAKLALTGAILNADLAGNIAITKLASYPTDATKALFGDATWKNLVSNTTASGAGALQDLAVPTTGLHYHTAITAGGGSIRSVGIPALGAGSRISIRAGFSITIKHNTAGGTGQPLFTRTSADVLLAAGESIDFNFDGTNWAEQSRDQAVAGATTITPATTLPGSPTDGQQSILTDSTTAPTYAWLLQWSATASKFFFLGGSPLANYVSAGLASNVAPGASYVDFTGQPTVTVPRAGTYVVRHGAAIWCNTTTITATVTVKNGANAASDNDSVYVQNIPTSNGAASVAKSTQFSGVASSAVIKQQWKTSSGNATITQAFVEVTPVYVT